ncbi:MAG: hypothetical protein ACREP9_11525 [Candidatus Dormibacteraceae bacterium]
MVRRDRMWDEAGYIIDVVARSVRAATSDTSMAPVQIRDVYLRRVVVDLVIRAVVDRVYRSDVVSARTTTSQFRRITPTRPVEPDSRRC